MEKVAITIEFDVNKLSTYTDEFLATLWHVAQANPADGFATSEPGEIAQKIGWEIIRRWLRGVDPEMYRHQQQHYCWDQLRKLASYKPGGPAGTPEWSAGQWVPRTAEDLDAASGGDQR